MSKRSDLAEPSGPRTAARLRRSRTRQLSLAAIQSDRQVNEALARMNARKWHYAVLATLEEFGSASQAELSDRTGIYRSDLVGVVTELTERGMLDRSPNPADRRQNSITLTAQGRCHLLKLDKLLAEVEDEVFASLTPAERDQLSQLLTVLLEGPRP